MNPPNKQINRETNLIILSAFVGAFMGSIVNRVIDSGNFIFDLTMACLFVIIMFLTVPIALRRFNKC